MGRHNTTSGILVLVVIVMIAVSTYMAVTYANSVLTAAASFASSSQITKMQACGITAPPELYKLAYDVPNVILPAIYAGLPALLVIIAILMFVAGYYHGEKEGHESSETTTTTSSPNRSRRGRYASGRRVEQTRTQKSTKTGEM